MSRGNRPPPKDMYWFAHGGPESETTLLQRNSVLFDGEDEAHASNSPTWNTTTERRASPDEQRAAQNVTDGGSYSSGPPSLERDDRLRNSDKRIAVEERRKQLWEAEQERNDAVLRKHMEREAALEARRNASRSNIAFAFGSSIPRNVETVQVNEGGDSDIMSRSFTSGSSHREETHNSFHDRRSVSPLNYNGHIPLVHDKSDLSNPSQSCTTSYSERRVMSPPSWLFGSGALIGEDVMSKSMTASSAPRGRRKNDLMPTVPYDRTPTPRAAASSSSRKRSVSMTRLDQLALPRKHYVEANKASSSASSANSSMLKDNVRSPTRPLSSASENSGGSGLVSSSVTRRIRSTPRKPRPVSIAGTLPEQRQVNNTKPFEVKVSPVKKSYTPNKQCPAAHSVAKNSTPKTVEKMKQTPRLSTPPKLSTPKPTTPRTTAHKPSTPKTPKQTDIKQTAAKQAPAPKTPTSKAKDKKPLSAKKKTDVVTSSPLTREVRSQPEDTEKRESPSPALDSDVAAENEKNNSKRIISEEEAKAALAEKRRLAREQAEREAELERQRQEQLRLEEEERLRKEEEDHRKMEEEQMRLLEEHRRQEEEKLRKAIEDQEQKEEEERAKRDEEMRMKAEQEKKAKEEAEKQRLELEEKLRKEEEERAERKKRLEKIMSRTRGKSSGTSPSGSMSGSDHLDSGENPQEGFSSGANSLDSNEAEIPSEQASMDDPKADIYSAGDSLEANPTYEIGSENESLNSNDLMMPVSETASQDNSLVIAPEKDSADTVVSSMIEETGTSSQPPEGVHDLQESSTVDASENSNNHPVEGTREARMEEIVTSMVAEPVYIQEMDHSNIHSEVSIQENQFQNHLESGQAHGDVMATMDLSETNYDTQSHLLSDSNLPEEVENQQDLGESDKPQISSDKTEVEVAHQETSEESPSQHDLNHEDPSITTHFPDEINMEVSALDSEMFENQARSSISSDIKLPDPIYETSEDGSISSEKHQTFGMQEEFVYARNQENNADDVFSQQVILPDPESVPQNENPFEMNAFNANQNPFSAEYSVQRSDVDLNESSTYAMSDSTYETGDPNVFSQEYGMGENREIVITSQASTSSVIEADVHQSGKTILEDDSIHHRSFDQDNKENIPTEIIYDIPVSQPFNQSNDYNVFANGSAHHFDEDNMSDGNIERDIINGSVLEDQSFPLKQSQENFESNSVFDQGVVEKQQTKNPSFEQQEVEDVTLIKADDSGACIGIISSIDHDQTSNNFSKSNLLNEQLKNNFESASMTDSEDNSSLDSNLSQVTTVEGSEKDTVGGLNHVEISESSKNGYSNGEKHNPFHIGNMYNGSLSKSSVNNFHASEMFSNGLGLDSSTPTVEQMSDLPGYVHLGGNGVLSVDHSKNNIFATADAIDYGKVSPDPFLVKGNSNQIPGNPFLLQDDQKQVLMAPDFLN